jgi:hypothetical protein
MKSETFDISLSLDQPDATLGSLLKALQQVQSQYKAAAPGKSPDYRNVLLIDADEERAHYLAHLLVRAGYRPIVMANAFKAFSRFLQVAYVPFLIMAGHDDSANRLFLQRLTQQITQKYQWSPPLIRMHFEGNSSLTPNFSPNSLQPSALQVPPALQGRSSAGMPLPSLPQLPHLDPSGPDSEPLPYAPQPGTLQNTPYTNGAVPHMPLNGGFQSMNGLQTPPPRATRQLINQPFAMGTPPPVTPQPSMPGVQRFPSSPNQPVASDPQFMTGAPSPVPQSFVGGTPQPSSPNHRSFLGGTPQPDQSYMMGTPQPSPSSPGQKYMTGGQITGTQQNLMTPMGYSTLLEEDGGQPTRRKVMSLEGQSLGRYAIVSALGDTGSSNTYKTYDRLRERDIALKAFQTDAMPYYIIEKTLEEGNFFQWESDLLSELQHPHISPVWSTGKSYVSGTPFIYKTIPFYEEGSLAQWVQRNSGNSKMFAPRDVGAVLLQLADALQYLHDHQITFQNFKLTNILIRNQTKELRELELVLTDFAIPQDGSFFSRMPEAYPYMAPERWYSQASPSSDQYGLAVIVYELLTGRHPFQGTAERTMKLLHTNMPVQPPSTFNPYLPPVLNNILLRALAKNPVDRFASVALFARTYQQYCM